MYPYTKAREIFLLSFSYTDTHTCTHRVGGDDVKVEAEIGIMWPETKKCQQPPETGGSKDQILP